MKNFVKLLLVLIATSCASSSDVVHKGIFQKRKYKKGYHLSFKKAEKAEKVDKEITLLSNSSLEEKEVEKGGVKESFYLFNVEKNSDSILYVSDESIAEVYASVDDSYSELKLNSLERIYLNATESEFDENVDRITVKRDGEKLAEIGGWILLGSLLIGSLSLFINVGAGFISPFVAVAFVVFSISVVVLIIALFMHLGSLTSKDSEVEGQKESGSDGQKDVGVNKKTVAMSNVFTWGSIILPFLIIPAIVFNFIVIKDSVENKYKNNAKWRLLFLIALVLLLLFVFV